MTAADPRKAFEDTQTEYGASRYGEWRRCRKAHSLRYHLRVTETPIEDDPVEEDDRPRRSYFAVGRIVHGVHRWVREGVMAGESRAWRVALDVTPALGFELEAVYEAERLVHAYYGLWGTDNAGFPEGTKILAVEHEMRAPVGHPIAPYTARADAIVELASGQVVIVDDKTRAQAFPKDKAKYARGASTRPQFAGLSWLHREATDAGSMRPEQGEPTPIWINGIIKTKIVKVDRVMVTMTHDTLDRWARAQADTSAELQRETHAPENWSECAPEIGSPCQYFTWCHGTDEEKRKHFTVKGKAA